MKNLILMLFTCFFVMTNAQAQFSFTTSKKETISNTAKSTGRGVTSPDAYIDAYLDITTLPETGKQEYFTIQRVSYYKNEIQFVDMTLVPLNEVSPSGFKVDLQYNFFSFKADYKTRRVNKVGAEELKTGAYGVEFFYYSGNLEVVKTFFRDKLLPSLDKDIYLKHKEYDVASLKQSRMQLKKVICEEYSIAPNPVVRTETPQGKENLAEAKKLFEERFKSKNNDERKAKKDKIMQIAPTSQYGQYLKLGDLHEKYITERKSADKDLFEANSKEFIENYPDFAFAYYVRGLFFNYYYEYQNSSDRASEAISLFTKAIALKPNEAVFYYQRGVAYQLFIPGASVTSYEKSLQDLNKAIALDSSPDYIEKRNQVVKSAKTQAEFDKKYADENNETPVTTTKKTEPKTLKDKILKDGAVLEIAGNFFYNYDYKYFDGNFSQIGVDGLSTVTFGTIKYEKGNNVILKNGKAFLYFGTFPDKTYTDKDKKFLYTNAENGKAYQNNKQIGTYTTSSKNWQSFGGFEVACFVDYLGL